MNILYNHRILIEIRLDLLLFCFQFSCGISLFKATLWISALGVTKLLINILISFIDSASLTFFTKCFLNLLF